MKNYKEKLNNYKEFMSNPRNKALIKLGGYFLFFLILFILATIANGMKKNNLYNKVKTTTKTTTKVVENFNLKLNKLLENNHDISYEINGENFNYKINGNIKDKVLNGYLENNNEIKKIKLYESTLYEVSNDIDNIANFNFDSSLIDIYNIIGLIELERPFINSSDLVKTYEYNFNIDGLDYLINIYANEDNIEKIIIKSNNIEYILNFDN